MIKPIPFAIESADGRFTELNGSRIVNLYPEQAPANSKSKVILRSVFGEQRYSIFGFGGYQIKAMIAVGDYLYVLTATKFLKINVNTNAVATQFNIVVNGSIVSIASNGWHIVFVDGIKGYYYDSYYNTIAEFSGDGWYAADTVTFIDGYFIFNRKGTNQFFWSGILAVTLDPLDYATASIDNDNVTGCFALQSSLWVFGSKSIEIWYDDGVTPWSRMHGAYIPRGLGSLASVINVSENLIFVGDDGVVYKTSGYTIQPISTHAIDYHLSLRNRFTQTFAYTYSVEGHVFYVLTIPDTSYPTQAKTFVYDIVTGLWSEMSHNAYTRHNGFLFTTVNNKTFLAEYLGDGNLYSISQDYYKNDTTSITKMVELPILNANNNRLTLNSVELDIADCGTINGKLPEVLLQWSDNAGVTWSTARARIFATTTKKGKKVRWNCLGQFRQRLLRFTITDDAPIAIFGVYADVEVAND